MALSRATWQTWILSLRARQDCAEGVVQVHAQEGNSHIAADGTSLGILVLQEVIEADLTNHQEHGRDDLN